MRASLRGYSTKARYPGGPRFRMLCLVLVAVVGLLASLFLGRFFEIRRLKSELSSLMEQERTALATQEMLREQLALKDDPQMLENKARELLGLVKPSEEKVIFIEGD